MRQHIQATRAITSGTEEMNIPHSDEVDEFFLCLSWIGSDLYNQRVSAMWHAR